MLRPITATLRLNLTAVSQICWIRCTLDENVATIDTRTEEEIKEDLKTEEVVEEKEAE